LVEQMQTNYGDRACDCWVTLSALLLLIRLPANIANLLLAARVGQSFGRRRSGLALGASRSRLGSADAHRKRTAGAGRRGRRDSYLAYVGTHAILLVAFRGRPNMFPSRRGLSPGRIGPFRAGFWSVATGDRCLELHQPGWTSQSYLPMPLRSSRPVPRSTARSGWFRKSLVIVQVAFSIVLLIGAGPGDAKYLRNLE